MENRQAYVKSGVDVDEGYKAVEAMRKYVESTNTPQVLSNLGGFAGLFQLGHYEDPVLVSGTDGVGTKLKVAFAMNRHDTVGKDLVAMCANDILCQGARPLFFLDYVAVGKLEAVQVSQIVKGIAEGCKEASMALLGGETAEMPGFYEPKTYELAGFAVGVVEKKDIIDGHKVKSGDILIGLKSSGIHSNGFSLVRRVLLDEAKQDLNQRVEGIDRPLGEELLSPTRIYVKTIEALKKTVSINGMAHITGGGFYENIPRMFSKELCAHINMKNWKVPKIFKIIQEKGKLSTDEMFHIFNMGIGFVVAVDSNEKDRAMEVLKGEGETPVILGTIEAGSGDVVLL